MRPRASSTATCAGVHPERPPTEPEASRAAKKAWVMNGLNRSPSASSNERPGGLAQASHVAASMAAMDGTTRAVKAEDMGGQAVRSGGFAHLSMHGAVFVVKASSLACGANRPRAASHAKGGRHFRCISRSIFVAFLVKERHKRRRERKRGALEGRLRWQGRRKAPSIRHSRRTHPS
jgi:hypothetical protein